MSQLDVFREVQKYKLPMKEALEQIVRYFLMRPEVLKFTDYPRLYNLRQ